MLTRSYYSLFTCKTRYRYCYLKYNESLFFRYFFFLDSNRILCTDFCSKCKKDVKIIFFSREIELKKYMLIVNIVRYFHE